MRLNKKMIKIQSITILLIVLAQLILPIVPISIAKGTKEEPWDISLTEEDNVTAYVESNTLYIQGTGNMDNYSYDDAPWRSLSENIQTINISEGVTNIGDTAFYGCTNITSITIPKGITTIGDRVFDYCISLINVEVDENNTKYSSVEGVLFNKEKTELIFYPSAKEGDTYSIPNGVTIIADSAFENCNNLTNIILSENTTEIKDSAFNGCIGLTNITIPEKVERIGVWAFESCFSLTSITVEEANKNYCSTDGILFNKNKTEIIRYPLAKEETTYSVPEGVTNIGISAFSDCSNLTNIILPKELVNINSGAFTNCIKLTNIDLPEGLTNIGYNAFSNCSVLTNITLPKTVKSIEYYAFNNCTEITTITIPEAVTEIGNGVFSNCTNLANIIVEEANTNYCSVEGVLFDKNKTKLICYPAGKDNTNYSVPTGVTTIENDAFEYCSNLESVTIPKGVTNIGDNGFWFCDNLKTVIIPEGITNLGNCTFYGCSNLTSIELPKGLTSIGYSVFEDCGSLTNIVLPEGITSIGNEAFANCDVLTSVILPEGVTNIGEKVFSNCSSLSNITIPASIQTIGTKVFELVDEKKITVYYYEGCEAIENYATSNSTEANFEEVTLSKIEIKDKPKTNYYVGDTLDTTGLTLTAIYNNGASQTITTGFTTNPEHGTKLTTLGTTEVTVSYAEKTVKYNVTVEEAPKITITSSVYNVDEKYISKVKPNTIRDQFLTNISTSGTIKIYKNQEEKLLNKEVQNEEIITTGMILELNNGDTYEIIVTGDVNGDGQTNLVDLSRMKLHQVSVQLLEGVYLKAADINYDNAVNLIDLSRIKLVVIGVVEI